MKSFREQLADWSAKAEADAQKVFVRASEIVHESVVVGSPVTGSPGQPVDTGYLRNSFTLEQVGPLQARSSTNVSYAPAVENDDEASYDPIGVDRPEGLKSTHQSGGKHIKSEVGGPHSVKLTKASWQRVVDTACQEVVGARG